MKLKILIVEDDPVLGPLLCDYFELKEWETVLASDGETALYLFQEDTFQLVLLDVMLPKQDGFTVCKKIREISDIPIFFITARVMEEDELHGYSLGADDYITKPFSFPVLYAKAVSTMKRVRGNVSYQTIKRGNLTVDAGSNKVLIHNETIHLPKLQYQILLYFLENPNRILSREQLLVRFWGYDFDGNERVVDNQIKKLRKALKNCDCNITTVHKSGYRMEVPHEKEEHEKARL